MMNGYRFVIVPAAAAAGNHFSRFSQAVPRGVPAGTCYSSLSVQALQVEEVVAEADRCPRVREYAHPGLYYDAPSGG
jgi:hypothetical protein